MKNRPAGRRPMVASFYPGTGWGLRQATEDIHKRIPSKTILRSQKARCGGFLLQRKNGKEYTIQTGMITLDPGRQAVPRELEDLIKDKWD